MILREEQHRVEDNFNQVDLTCTACGCVRTVSWLDGVQSFFIDAILEGFDYDHSLCEPGTEIDIVTGEVV